MYITNYPGIFFYRTNTRWGILVNPVMRMLTFLIWIIFAVSLIWALIIIFWMLIDFFGPQYLYMPEIIRSSSTVFTILFCWMIIVSIIFFYFTKRNKPNPNTLLELPDNTAQSYLWAEIVSSPSENNQLLKQRLLSDQELNSLPPSKLLSYGINLYNQAMINCYWANGF